MGDPMVTRQDLVPRPGAVRGLHLNAASGRGRLGSRTGTGRGDGDEFDAVTTWVDGDDLRHVAWAATARTGELQVRRYRAPQRGVIAITVDTAASMSTGGIEPRWPAAVKAAAVLSGIALNDGDDVTIQAGDRHLPTTHHVTDVEVFCSDLLTGGCPATRTLSDAPTGVDLHVVVTDLFSRSGHFHDHPGDQPTLVVVVHDRHEYDLPAMGRRTITHPETAVRFDIDTDDDTTRAALSRHMHEWWEETRSRLLADGISVIRLWTDDDALTAIAAGLRRR